MTVSIEDQIACVAREIKMRKHVYPRWAADGRMTADKATKELAAMEAVLATLEGLRPPPAQGGLL